MGCLLLHMFQPDQGKILVYEREAQEVGLWQWRQWFSYVQQLRDKYTILMVSHKLKRVMDADRIYVMDKGKVVESGTHGELMNRNGVYKRLWDANGS